MGFILPTPQNDDLNTFLEQADSVADITNTKLCPCGKLFTPYRSFQIYHSDECRVKLEGKQPSRYVKKLFVTKLCPQCSKEFRTNDSKKVYCTNDCYLAHEAARHIDPEERVCAVCGTKFRTTHWSKRYCSNECRREARRER